MKYKVINNKNLIDVLQHCNVRSSFISKLKIRYRPLICPFVELLNEISDNDSVYDIGCGSGQFCLLASKFTNTNKIKGIEISKDLVYQANQIISTIDIGQKILEFEKYDGLIIPNDIKDYNIIFLIDVIHHIPASRQVEFLQNIYNKMGLGSKLIVKDIDRSSIWCVFNKLHDLVFSGELGNERNKIWYYEKLNEIGFTIERLDEKRTFVYPHVTFVCKK